MPIYGGLTKFVKMSKYIRMIVSNIIAKSDAYVCLIKFDSKVFGSLCSVSTLF